MGNGYGPYTGAVCAVVAGVLATMGSTLWMAWRGKNAYARSPYQVFVGGELVYGTSEPSDAKLEFDQRCRAAGARLVELVHFGGVVQRSSQ